MTPGSTRIRIRNPGSYVGIWYVIPIFRTKEYIRSLKMNDECQALKFSKNGDLLYTHGEGGEVYVWDIRYVPNLLNIMFGFHK